MSLELLSLIFGSLFVHQIRHRYISVFIQDYSALFFCLTINTRFLIILFVLKKISILVSLNNRLTMMNTWFVVNFQTNNQLLSSDLVHY